MRLFPFEEGLCLGNVEGVRRSHGEDIAVQVFALERCLGLRDGRLQRTPIANAFRAPVARKRVLVDRKHVIHVKKFWIRVAPGV